MELETVVRGRRSVRRFRDQPLAAETVRELLELARWSPSWANTQSWSLYVVTGDALTRLKASFRERITTAAERRFDIPPLGPDWPDPLRARTAQLQAARQAATRAAFDPSAIAELFGAPCLVLFAVDSRLGAEYACFDTGLLVQTFCLAAHDRGLGTCIMAMAVAQRDLLHDLLPQAAGQRFVVGVALGHPETEAAVNNFARERAPLDELVCWVS